MWLVLLGLPKHSALPEFNQAFSLYVEVKKKRKKKTKGQLEKSQDTQNNFSHLRKPFIEVVEQHQHNFSDSKETKQRAEPARVAF